MPHGLGQGKHIIVRRSTLHPAKPPGQSSVTRAEVFVAGCLMQPNPAGAGVMCTDVLYMDMQGQIEQKVMDVIQLMIPVKRTQGRLVRILSAKQMSALIQENKLLKSQQGDQVQGLAA